MDSNDEGRPPAADAAAGLTSEEAAARLARDGPNAVAEKRTHPLLEFLRKFWGLSPGMLELIAALSLLLGKFADVWVALALLVLNAVIGWWQEQRASSAVAALRRQLQVTARVLRDAGWRAVPADELVRDDVVRVRIGDFVPADLRILDGELKVDQSALTGESQDVGRAAGAVLYAGSVVRQGETTGVVVATGVRTYFGRTTQLVESARPKLHIDAVVSRLVRQLFVVVGGLVGVTLAVSLVRGAALIDILPLSLVLLMSAVPVALPVMFTVSMALGAMQLAGRGVLITRLSAAEDAANMTVLCADKTGTLTQNRLSVTSVAPAPGFADAEVIDLGALASSAADRDPIDLAFIDAASGLAPSGPRTQVSFAPFSPATRRTEATIADADGRRFRVMKGALRTVAAACSVEGSALAGLEARGEAAAREGNRVLAVAKGEADGPWRLAGLAFLADPPRPDSRDLIARLRGLGVTVKMLTGDALAVAQALASRLGFGEVTRASGKSAPEDVSALIEKVDGLAEIYPEDKFNVVRGLQQRGHVVAMTGDGVNDAPALRQAEVGIAVSSATDVAKGAASVVLTTEGLGGVVELVSSGRAIYQRVLTWIINKVSRTILKAGFVTFAYLATGRFAISALGMILLVFMTDFVKIALSTDRVRPSQRPESWHIDPLIRLAVLLGVLMLIEALGLLAIGWRNFGLAADAGRLQTFTFETLLFFALFSILSIRERRAFWASRPSAVLSVALLADALVGILIGVKGLAELRPLALGQIAVVLGYAFFFSLLVNDVVKQALIARITRGRKLRAKGSGEDRGRALG